MENQTTTPHHHHHADQLNIEDIEFAERTQPTCARCGQPTRLVADDGVIWLDCIDFVDTPVLRRLLTMEFGHTHIAVLNEYASANS